MDIFKKEKEINKLTISFQDIETFRTKIDSGLYNTDEAAYFERLEQADFSETFNEMLKNR